jgi:hypothetical protein
MAEGDEYYQHVVFRFKCLFLRSGARKRTGPMGASGQGLPKPNRDVNRATLGACTCATTTPRMALVTSQAKVRPQAAS